jgi:hypothetical protein
MQRLIVPSFPIIAFHMFYLSVPEYILVFVLCFA